MTAAAGRRANDRPAPRSIALPLVLAAFAVALLIWTVVTGSSGVTDPTDPTSGHLSHGAVVLDSALLVFREGLETILVLAAITASMVGEREQFRRPVVRGCGWALGATGVTWLIAGWALNASGLSALTLQAATGLVAIGVLLVVMNWFFHKIYWTGWISHHNQRKKELIGKGATASTQQVAKGMVLLGFTSVYREGFEVVLFLQNLRVGYGSGVVLEGVLLGGLLTAATGIATFRAHRKLPYKKMLVATGILLGAVLLVMVGESIQECQQAHWLPTHHVGLPVPAWMQMWFAVFPDAWCLVAQVLAAGFVIGSYYLAEHVARRHRTGGSSREATAPPVVSPASSAAQPLAASLTTSPQITSPAPPPITPPAAALPTPVSTNASGARLEPCPPRPPASHPTTTLELPRFELSTASLFTARDDGSGQAPSAAARPTSRTRGAGTTRPPLNIPTLQLRTPRLGQPVRPGDRSAR